MALRGLTGLGLLVLGLFATPAMAFKEKEFVQPVLEDPAKGTQADFSATQIAYDPETGLAVASGDVRIGYGPYVLNASRVTFNEATGEFEANGRVELREPNGNILEAETLALRDKFREGFAVHLRALLTNDVVIKAEYAERQEGNITIFENASYTACKNCETKSGAPLWELATDQTTHDQAEKMLYHVKPRLKIAGKTVFGLPSFSHPDPSVKRKTGWLRPDVKRSNAFGVGVVTPYFWAPDPSYDVTLRPMITTKQGLLLDAEWRQRLANGQYSVRGMGLYELDDDATEADSRWRGAIEAKGEFELSEHWTAEFDGTLVSDRDFLDDYDFEGGSVLKSEAQVTGLWDRNYVNAKALHYRSLSDGVLQERLPTALPYVSGEHYLANNLLGGDLSVNWSSYVISRDVSYSPFSEVQHGTSQMRAHAEMRWKSQYISDAGMVMTPFARMRADIYSTDNVPDPTVIGGVRSSETTSRFLPAAGFDLRYPWISSHGFGQSIISPVIQVIAATDETDAEKIGNEDAITLNFDHSSLFLEDRFTGYDRFEGGTRANVGFTATLLGWEGGFLRASAGESFHLSGKNSFAAGSGLDGSKSDLVGSLTYSPSEALTLSYEIRAEEDLSAINRQSAFLSLTFDRFATNIGYLNIAAEPAYGRNRDEEWFDADARVGLSEGWFLFGGLRYDIENSNLDKRSVGVEFDCDCMNFKLAYSAERAADEVETDHRITASIDLATLGGTKAAIGF